MSRKVNLNIRYEDDCNPNRNGFFKGMASLDFVETEFPRLDFIKTKSSWLSSPWFAANGNTLFQGTIENSIQGSTADSWTPSSVPSESQGPPRIPTHQAWAMRIPAPTSPRFPHAEESLISHHWTRTRCGFVWSADFACEGVDVQILRLGILQRGEIWTILEQELPCLMPHGLGFEVGCDCRTGRSWEPKNLLSSVELNSLSFQWNNIFPFAANPGYIETRGLTWACP
jgi:hypothetical protein